MEGDEIRFRSRFCPWAWSNLVVVGVWVAAMVGDYGGEVGIVEEESSGGTTAVREKRSGAVVVVVCAGAAGDGGCRSLSL